MRSPIVHTLVAAAGVVVTSAAHAAIVTEVYTDRSAFESRLAGAVRIVDFDDIDTASVDPLAFAAERYAPTLGIVISGQSGQFASRDFGFPEDYPVSSAPNAYAPGPMDDTIGGGNRTDVTFLVGSEPAAVAGFGAVFIDPDLALTSGIAVFDESGTLLGSEDVPDGDGDLVFRGIVAIDDATGMPAPVITHVELVNGTGWPAGTFNDGVPLDDFVFGVPAPPGAATTTTTTTILAASTTSTTLVSTLCAVAPLPACRRPTASGEAMLVVRKRRNAARDRLTWLWDRGASTAKEDFGNPPDTTAFAFCLYDAAGLRLAAAVPAGGTCDGALCWTTTPAGYRYSNPGLAPDGVRALRLAAGAEGRSRIRLKARGAGVTLAVPLVTPVTAQLIRSDGGPCWDARFSIASRSTTSRFKAFSD